MHEQINVFFFIKIICVTVALENRPWNQSRISGTQALVSSLYVFNMRVDVSIANKYRYETSVCARVC
jgi:hypothetical protein